MNVQIHNKSKEKTAVLYRMVTDEHICPFGLKSRDLLKRQGYKVEDHQFQSKQEADDFREEHGVKTTPQTFIDGERIGGYDDLRAHFGKDKQQEESDETTYQPIVAMFSMALLLAGDLLFRLGHEELRKVRILLDIEAFLHNVQQ